VKSLDAWLESHKAGSPTQANVYWIHYRPYEISKLFQADTGQVVSHGLIKKRLLFLKFGYRKMRKDGATGDFADRDLQFKLICSLLLMMCLKSPVISIDCKKKEVLGNLYRAGKCYTQGQTVVYDHDYAHLAEGTVIPHGIYDLQRNEGYLTIGTDHETAAFIVDNLEWWWENYGKHQYPDASSIFILCDAGGANSYRHHIFKQKLLELAEKTGKHLMICHYPPYASKWNPIEHRLFAHVHIALQGVLFDTYETVKKAIDRTTTKTGLKVVCRIVQKEYPIGEKINKKDVQYHRIKPDERLPTLSYKVLPKEEVI
jgi:Rhodopirellula transposase DDE domain